MLDVSVSVANGLLREQLRAVVERNHYLRSAPDPRTRPLCYEVTVGSCSVGCLWFGRTQSTSCYRGLLTYGSQDDVASGRAAFDRWEVLNLSRVWLNPYVQPGGPLHGPRLPGFTDRKGQFRSTLASTVIRLALRRVGLDYLLAHPPVFLDQPYRIRAVLSYCDTRLHRGVIYRAAGFTLSRCNEDGIETWYTTAVAPLSDAKLEAVRQASERCPRSRRLRDKACTLFPLEAL